jgi:predicted lactoylglutathione lyase
MAVMFSGKDNAFVSLLRGPHFQMFKIEHDTSKRTTQIETVKKSTADGFSHRSSFLNERQIFSLATSNCFIVLLGERHFSCYLTQNRFDVNPVKFHPFDACASTTNLWSWNSDSFPQFRDDLAKLIHGQSRTKYLFEIRFDL